jgi:hypothetical protein
MHRDYTNSSDGLPRGGRFWDSLQGLLAFRPLRRFQIHLQFGGTLRELVE